MCEEISFSTQSECRGPRSPRFLKNPDSVGRDLLIASNEPSAEEELRVQA